MARRATLVSALALAMALLHAIGVLSGSLMPPDRLERRLSQASSNLVAYCDSVLLRLGEESDTVEAARTFQLDVQGHLYVANRQRTHLFVLLGCHGRSELILLDSTDEQAVILRKQIQTPTCYTSLGEVRDINNDGVPELSVYMGSGSHGMYVAFISLYKDSLAFIRNEGERYKFFASGSGIGVEDLDGDSVCEIVIQDMIWPGEKDPPERRDIIYRWRDGLYQATDTVELRKGHGQ